MEDTAALNLSKNIYNVRFMAGLIYTHMLHCQPQKLQYILNQDILSKKVGNLSFSLVCEMEYGINKTGWLSWQLGH